MLTRSGFSIRRLISQRRPKPLDDDSDSADHDEIALIKTANKQGSQPWIQTRQTTSRRKGPPEPIMIRRTSSVHKISTPIPPLPGTPPHSNSSSFSGCEHHQGGGIDRSRSRRNVSPSLSADEQYSSRAMRQPRTPKRRTNASLHPNSAMYQVEEPPRPSLNMPERNQALGGVEKRARRATVDPNRLERWSENVQQLIRETDHAFNAVGVAMNEMNTAPQGMGLPIRPASPPPAQRPDLPAPEVPQVRTVLKKQKPRLLTSPLTSPTRNASVSKRNRKGKKKRRSKIGGNARQVPKQQPRWTLTENVAELFSGQFFRRIEADEMLTPSQLEQFRESRQAQLRPRKSTESLKSEHSEDGSDTPIEPFHLEDLPSRIGAAGVKTTVSPIDGYPPPVPFEEVVRRDFSVPRKSLRPKPEDIVVSPLSPEEEDFMAIHAMSFPSPPLRNPARFISRSQMPQLPTIPEILTSPTTAQPTHPAQPHRRGRRRKPFSPFEDGEFVFFKCSPYTVTVPTFRHGPIRFSKAEVGMKMAADNTLDWTAFQMAILGGSGDFRTGSADFTCQGSEVGDVDELVDWFDGFGFETAGELIHCDEDFDASPSTAEYSPVSSIASEDFPIPVELEHPNGFWNEGEFDTSKFVTEGCGIKRWTVEGHPKPYKRQSVDSVLSLPQSPMMSLVLTRTVETAKGPVPMGYNLGHDLGDFLRWEAEHLYASEYYD